AGGRSNAWGSSVRVGVSLAATVPVTRPGRNLAISMAAIDGSIGEMAAATFGAMHQGFGAVAGTQGRQRQAVVPLGPGGQRGGAVIAGGDIRTHQIQVVLGRVGGDAPGQLVQRPV